VKHLLATDRLTSPLGVAIAGGMCGIFSWTLVFPLDTMKSIVGRREGSG